ncbi:hypothetical protein TNIN_253141 [Trichonephila inaurata madagascariensis]|uniref:Uncharacterized protein n=1 Tax=Trichonephila inaurata madagascariensis TaxID=2747483 RepID=A0A8X6XCA4_9ARAC|nr:hypothetical protein TNIN_174931 [Trichonephila inaurata madagascariensis]GFY56932.1 hypothetical protein TNIN_253141 [Trichonephila inaurata madagascariensis]
MCIRFEFITPEKTVRLVLRRTCRVMIRIGRDKHGAAHMKEGPPKRQTTTKEQSVIRHREKRISPMLSSRFSKISRKRRHYLRVEQVNKLK